MSVSVAHAVFSQLDSAHGDVTLLAEGTSSQAWVGLVDGIETVVRIPRSGGDGPTPTYRRKPAAPVAFALYKLDKTPTRTDVIERVGSML